MWWIIGAFIGWVTRQAVTQHNQAKTMSQVPDWQGDKPQSLPTRSRALLYAGAASYLFIALLVSLVSVSSALVVLAVGAFAVWSYRRSSRKKYASFVNQQPPSAPLAPVTNSAATSPALPDVIEASAGMARPSAGTGYKASQTPVELAGRQSDPKPKDAVELKTGGWADLSTATLLCSWMGPTQSLGKQRFSVYRTRRGSLILKEPATGINWGLLGSSNITYQYAEGPEEQIVQVMVAKEGAREARQVFPGTFETMRVQHYSSER